MFARNAFASLSAFLFANTSFAMRSASKVAKSDALPGRAEAMKITNEHFVLKNPVLPPFPENTESAVFGTGCFWGTERVFYKRLPGIYCTSVGYIAGDTPNPTYQEVCSGRTNHNEVVQVVWDTSKLSFADVLKAFWEQHDPTQGNRQGGDAGTQYRSGIYVRSEAQRTLAEASKAAYQAAISKQGHGAITTEIITAPDFYYAEDYHQQYLDKPGNRQYCSAQPLGIELPHPSEWNLPDDVKATIKTQDEVWGRTFAGCVFG